MDAAIQNINYHLGLLHFVHLLVTVDGVIDERERRAIARLRHEESIPDLIFAEFENAIKGKNERLIYEEGVERLNRCNDVEKLCAFVHLYLMAEADDNIHVKEVRFLLYSLKATQVSFEDVEFAVNLAKGTAPSLQTIHRRVA